MRAVIAEVAPAMREFWRRVAAAVSRQVRVAFARALHARPPGPIGMSYDLEVPLNRSSPTARESWPASAVTPASN